METFLVLFQILVRTSIFRYIYIREIVSTLLDYCYLQFEIANLNRQIKQNYRPHQIPDDILPRVRKRCFLYLS